MFILIFLIVCVTYKEILEFFERLFVAFGRYTLENKDSSSNSSFDVTKTIPSEGKLLHKDVSFGSSNVPLASYLSCIILKDMTVHNLNPPIIYRVLEFLKNHRRGEVKILSYK